MKDNFWLVRGGIAFGAQLVYILLILLVQGLCGALLAFLPLVLMPLFECGFGFFFSLFTVKKSKSPKPTVLCALSGLLAAGALYEIANLAIHGFTWEWSVLLYDASVTLCLLLGCFFAFRLAELQDKMKQRRTRFDD